MKKILPFILVCCGFTSYSQVGIGTPLPNSSSQLEVVAKDRGILIPQVQLTSSTDKTTITNGNVNSLLVYNTVTRSDVKSGYYYWTDDRWNRMVVSSKLVTNEGTVIYNPITNEFTYLDDHGAVHVIDFSTVVKANETLTSASFVPATGIFTYKDENGTATDLDLSGFNNTPETLTSISQDVTAGTITYVDEKGASTDLDVKQIIAANETLTSASFVAATGILTYNDEKGAATNLDLSSLINTPETLTSVSQDSAAGTITYVDENGTSTDLDVKQIVDATETVTSLTDIVTEQTDEYGQVFELHTLTYVDENGTSNPIDLTTLVKGVETVTTLVYDGASQSLVYTNEDGAATDFNLVDLVGEVQTLTALDINTTEGTLDYTDENKELHALDLAVLVKEPWYDVTTNTGATSNSSNMYTNGWVGIGFTTPSAQPDEKLRVNGSISTINSYYADYVFEDYYSGASVLKPEYNFKSLSQVDKFIKENKHLPGITPIHELNKTDKGYAFNLSELSVQLLEKTEELYLHVIEQNKEINAKSAEIESMKKSSDQMAESLNEMKERLEKLEMILSEK